MRSGRGKVLLVTKRPKFLRIQEVLGGFLWVWFARRKDPQRVCVAGGMIYQRTTAHRWGSADYTSQLTFDWVLQHYTKPCSVVQWLMALLQVNKGNYRVNLWTPSKRSCKNKKKTRTTHTQTSILWVFLFRSYLFMVLLLLLFFLVSVINDFLKNYAHWTQDYRWVAQHTSCIDNGEKPARGKSLYGPSIWTPAKKRKKKNKTRIHFKVFSLSTLSSSLVTR